MPDEPTQCYIKVNGSNISEEVAASLIDVTVESSLHLASVATFTLFDNTVTWIERSCRSVSTVSVSMLS